MFFYYSTAHGLSNFDIDIMTRRVNTERKGEEILNNARFKISSPEEFSCGLLTKELMAEKKKYLLLAKS